MFDPLHSTGVLTLFFVANALYCLSYLVRDILWLRAIAVLAALSTFPYFYFQAEPMYLAIAWQAAFLVINLAHAIIVFRERMPTRLTAEQGQLHRSVFPLFTPRQMLRLLDIAESDTADPGETLIRQGEPAGRLVLVLDGAVKVANETRVRAHLGQGQFAGEMSLISGRPTSAHAVATAPTRYLAWNAAKLASLWRRHPRLKGLFESTLSLDMVHKLAESGQEVPDT